MSKRRAKGSLVPIIVVILAIGLFGVFGTKAYDRVDQVVEWEGHRQVDHKYFGVIPYSDVKDSPTSHVDAEAAAALKSSGLTLLEDLKEKSAERHITKSTQGTSTSYLFSMPTKQSSEAVLAYYAKQLHSSSKVQLIGGCEGFAADGKTWVQAVADPSGHEYILQLIKKDGH